MIQEKSITTDVTPFVGEEVEEEQKEKKKKKK